MPLPLGLATKTLTFGRYSSALGSNLGGEIAVKFDDPMLHVPTGEVVTGSEEKITIDAATGTRSVAVPVTVTDDLVANWRDESAYTNQRLRVQVSVPGYRNDVSYIDVHPADPATIDFDQMDKYASPGGLPVLRAAVTSVAGLDGVITASALVAELEPYLPGSGAGAVGGMTYNQGSAANPWVITNTMGRYPAAVMIVVGGEQVYADVAIPNPSTIVITFPEPTAGRAEII